jgi:hypothetical protein
LDGNDGWVGCGGGEERSIRNRNNAKYKYQKEKDKKMNNSY